MKNIFKTTLWMLVCFSLCTANSSAELQIAPKALKTQVIIIGTIHEKHYENPKYSPEALRKIIFSLKPDAILNELPLSLVDPDGRPIESIRKQDRWGPETWASDTVATQLGIRQIPFDRPDRDENYRKTNYLKREKQMFELIDKWQQQMQKEDPNSVDLKIISLSEYAYKIRDEMLVNFGPKEYNSELFDLIIRIKQSITNDIEETIYRKYPAYEGLADICKFFRDQWLERNKIMAENIKKAAREYPGKRLVVITGAEHRCILRDLLKDVNSIDLKEYWEIAPPEVNKHHEPNEPNQSIPQKEFVEQWEKMLSENGPVLTKEQRIFGLVTIYRGAKQHFAYFERLPNLDWDKTFMDFLPEVEKEQSPLEYYRTLQRFTALLQDGHTGVYLPLHLERQMDKLPITLEYVENQWVVVERWPTEEIIEEDIPLGTVIVSIDENSPSEYFEKNLFPYIGSGTIQDKRTSVNQMTFFPKDTEIRIKLSYPDGNTVTRTIKANRRSAKSERKLHVKYMYDLRSGNDFVLKQFDRNILYIRYKKCNDICLKRFSETIESLHPPLPMAMIIDLRYNGGGCTPVDSVQRLISSPIESDFDKTPCSISRIDALVQYTQNQVVSKPVQELINKEMNSISPANYEPGWFFMASPRIEPAEKHYDGPLVILINAETFSAAESFAALLRGARRAKIIGEPSGGSSGEPIFFELPGGGKVHICTVTSRYPDGRDFVGVGIQPDIPVKRTIKGIVEKHDEILKAALDYINTIIDKTEKPMYSTQ
jgi:carboxyl-terminal processing protease